MQLRVDERIREEEQEIAASVAASDDGTFVCDKGTPVPTEPEEEPTELSEPPRIETATYPRIKRTQLKPIHEKYKSETDLRSNEVSASKLNLRRIAVRSPRSLNDIPQSLSDSGHFDDTSFSSPGSKVRI